MRFITRVAVLAMLVSCNPTQDPSSSETNAAPAKIGLWRASISLAGGEAPFQFSLSKRADTYASNTTQCGRKTGA